MLRRLFVGGFVCLSLMIAPARGAEEIDPAKLKEQLLKLDGAVDNLMRVSTQFGITPESIEVYQELVREKFMPQWELDGLVVAVAGPTNIGKSTLINAIVKNVVSKVYHKPAATSYPVAVVHATHLQNDQDVIKLMTDIFHAMAIKKLQSSEDPTGNYDDDPLFWTVAQNDVFDGIMIDLPDIDSDKVHNHKIAYKVAGLADVIVAVITQEKYGDKAVIEYFRELQKSGKPVILVVNKVDLEYQKAQWPEWVKDFKKKTGIKPVATCVVPLDHAAAARGDFAAVFNVGVNGTDSPSRIENFFDLIRAAGINSLRKLSRAGALRRGLNEGNGGIQGYLDAIRAKAKAYEDHLTALGEMSSKTIAEAEIVPRKLFVDGVLTWWDDSQRTSATKNIRAVYGAAIWVAGKVGDLVGINGGPQTSYQQEEEDLIKQFIVDTMQFLTERVPRTMMSDAEWNSYFGPGAVQHLQEAIITQHRARPTIEDALKEHLNIQLNLWARENPEIVEQFKKLDLGASIVTPAISIAMAVATGSASSYVPGLSLVFKALGPQLGAITQLTGAATAMGVGAQGAEKLTQLSAGATVMERFSEIYLDFVKHRITWITKELEQKHLKKVFNRLGEGSRLTTLPDFLTIEGCQKEILKALPAAT